MSFLHRRLPFRPSRPCLALIVTLVVGSSPALGQTANYSVATTGNDANPGSEAAPWRTIQKAARTAIPGSTVNIHQGVYQELVTVTVSGSAAAGYTTFQSAPGETAVLDGTGLTVPGVENGLLLLADRSYLRVKGLELRNLKTATRDLDPVGINVRGASHHIDILGNRIHDIQTNVTTAMGGDAHGIHIAGTSGTQPISNLIIDGNEVYNLRTGSSEAIALNGNVVFFEVTHNVVHDTNNIGIDFAGFYGVSPSLAVDQVRIGVCSDNRIYNIDSSHNPAYGGSFSGGGGENAADGIYVDGGTNIVIERNLVSTADIGIELASEHRGHSTSNVTIRDNVITNSRAVGISIGGYDTARGSTQGCKILNNTVFHSNTLGMSDGAELNVQYDVRDTVIENNVFYGAGPGFLIHNAFVQNIRSVVDFNLFFSAAPAAGVRFLWMNQAYTGWANYQQTPSGVRSGNDAHSRFANPLVVSESAPDVHLRPGSPAVAAGDSTVALAAETDVDQEPRIRGNSIDVGADELTSPALPTVPRAPTGLVGVGGLGQVALGWTDNAGNETGYLIERKPAAEPDAAFISIGTTGADGTTFKNTGLAAGDYTFRVRANNSAGNSDPSNAVIVTVAAPADVVTVILPEADAYVRSGASDADRNFGTALVLDVKTGVVANTNRNAFLRFPLAGLGANVTSAKLRLYGATVSPTTPTAKPASVFPVADITWGETTVTWNTGAQGGPAMGAPLDVPRSVPVGTVADDHGQYVEWDVTAYVQQRRAANAARLSFGVKSAASSEDAPISFKSKEAATNRPQLVITSRP